MRIPLNERNLPSYTRGEEIFHMVSHIAGGVFAFAALWFAHFLLPALSALRAESSSLEPLAPLLAAGEPS